MELVRDVHDQKKCRRCDKSAPVGGWTYVRLEFMMSPLLRPGQVAEVGLQFRCECGAIHLGEALQERPGRGGAWRTVSWRWQAAHAPSGRWILKGGAEEEAPLRTTLG